MSQTKFEIKRTSQFKKDLKRMMKRDVFDAAILNDVVEMLANDIELPENFRNHLLEPKSKRVMGMPFKTKLVIRVQKRWKNISFDIN